MEKRQFDPAAHRLSDSMLNTGIRTLQGSAANDNGKLTFYGSMTKDGSDKRKKSHQPWQAAESQTPRSKPAPVFDSICEEFQAIRHLQQAGKTVEKMKLKETEIKEAEEEFAEQQLIADAQRAEEMQEAVDRLIALGYQPDVAKQVVASDFGRADEFTTENHQMAAAADEPLSDLLLLASIASTADPMSVDPQTVLLAEKVAEAAITSRKTVQKDPFESRGPGSAIYNVVVKCGRCISCVSEEDFAVLEKAELSARVGTEMTNENGRRFRKGDPQLMYFLGMCLLNGYGTNNNRISDEQRKENQKRGFELLLWSAYQGFHHAMAECGFAMVEGEGTEKNFESGIAMLEQASYLNCPQAFYYLASICQADPRYLPELGDDQRDVKAFELFNKAAEMGSAESFRELSYFYLFGNGGVEKSNEMAFKCISKALEHGDMSAIVPMANAFLDGKGVSVDIKHGVVLLQEGAKILTMSYSDIPFDVQRNSLERLLSVYEGGRYGFDLSLPLTKRLVLDCLERLADLENKGAIESMIAGTSYMERCVEKYLKDVDAPGNAAKCEKVLYRIFLQNPTKRATCMLGDSIFNRPDLQNPERINDPVVVGQIYAKIIEFAESGDQDAQLLAGLIMSDGRRDSELNVAAGARLFERASQYSGMPTKTNCQALNRLARCYAIGEGMPQDYTSAFLLLRKAVDAGDRFAMATMGIHMVLGAGLSTNTEDGVRLLERSADIEGGYKNASAHGLYYLGYCYLTGTGVVKNKKMGVKLKGLARARAAETGEVKSGGWDTNAGEGSSQIELYATPAASAA